MAKTNKKKAGNVPNPIPPAGMRPDSRGEHGVPHPNDESIWEKEAKEMKMMNTLIGMAAGAAIGMAAGYAAREMGGVSTRQVKNQAKRAVRAMEQADDRLS